MEAGGQPRIPAPNADRVAAAPGVKRSSGRIRPLRARDVQLYRVCEDLTEVLIYAMVVFGPWAFGTTQPWSVWIMNGAGYLLGVVLVCKLSIRRLKGYHPSRWEDRHRVEAAREESEVRDQRSEVRGQRGMAASHLTALLAGLTVAILGYCLTSAVNARATYHPEALGFDYRKQYIPWLPHSLDSGRTWLAFWTYLGLALSFWAIRDWLLGKTEGEERSLRRKPSSFGDHTAVLLPARLRRLLWVLALNGTLLGMEGIAQRLQGGGKLLFLVRPRVNPGTDTQ